jgi:hypothetical protein
MDQLRLPSQRLSRGAQLALTVFAVALTGAMTISVQAAAAEAPPANKTLPRLTPGEHFVGQELKGVNGTWERGEWVEWEEWKRCSGSSCETVQKEPKGTTIGFYHTTEADAGKTLEFVVTEANLGGQTTVASEPSSVIQGHYGWFAPGQTRINGPVSAGGWGLFSIEFEYQNVRTQVVCQKNSGAGTLVSNASAAEINGLKLTLTGCSVEKPMAKECRVAGGTASFELWNAHTVGGLTPALVSLSPGSVGIGSFTLEHCSGLYYFVNHAYTIKQLGSLSLNYGNAGSSLVWPYSRETFVVENVYANVEGATEFSSPSGLILAQSAP